MSFWNRRNRCGPRRFGDDWTHAWTDLSRLHPDCGRWRRRPADGKLAGVCAGLAAAANVQPLLVRLGFVAAGLASGPFAVLVYIVLAAVLPVEPAQTPFQHASGPHPSEQTPPFPGDARRETQRAAAALAEVRARLDACDKRTAELERRVVADNMDLDRAIRDLERRPPAA